MRSATASCTAARTTWPRSWSPTHLVADLRGLVDLAPLHQPVALDAIEAVRRAAPDVPAVACFDTAFHADLPTAARTYALPREWRERHGLRRYGFHGLSYAYACRRAAELLGRDDLRLVVAHLGSGASLAAVRAGRSMDTTMGFTPLEGLVMATRAGTVDPGLVLWLVEHGRADRIGGARRRRPGRRAARPGGHEGHAGGAASATPAVTAMRGWHSRCTCTGSRRRSPP